MPEGKITEIRNNLRLASDDELQQELGKAKENLFTFRYQAATQQLVDVMQIRRERKHIARVMTIQRQRELERGKTNQG
ncbi:MAG: 50S ribosomal protein L29 [Armatimonadetes bacterium CG2_30_59_28]|nr:50S ribosomal protein L29 [Armatimonadota bacterium]OIO92496.1 MAG: 50S ribosomal protein L29 [Armatimonadetes bacterium CG2_30_59_28]PIU65728.1 MAG: 50S ribosomal protein L29 [Armatimonadetes bacterium CG07_land_8_20_14_0_80_59_28]PIX38261.1 MAG: 50S ribosomal protein L29 [Armatimonadetes bacterium CG_4_8_14_3_um_filter_58_9]PIY45099.1 MAG: 50S ribosomal protein L29 [Armatimonadetes bacterium CG_4_10_14_3_um_filter_59_10]PJB64798.1 MAG: 50S ribosomal protein L29 [Armatimonadetes bacterium 